MHAGFFPKFPQSKEITMKLSSLRHSNCSRASTLRLLLNLTLVVVMVRATFISTAAADNPPPPERRAITFE